MFNIGNMENFYFFDQKTILFICDPLEYNEKTIDNHFLKKLHDNFIKDGIKLYIIYDCEIDNKYNKIVSKLSIRNKTIYARKCDIREINNKVCSDFLDDYHHQGKIISKYRYGLFYQDELLAVMTFNKSRYNKKYDFEISRYCVKKDYNIPGNASKLFKYFMNYIGSSVSIIAYNDLRLGDGGVYEKIGMTRLKDSECGFFWYKNKNIYNRRGFWKNTLSKKLDNFIPEISAHNNMRNNGYVKIFDIGQSVYVKN